MQKFFGNLFKKGYNNGEEKRLNILSSIVERNKIKNSGASIDDVVAFSKTQKIKHDVYM